MILDVFSHLALRTAPADPPPRIEALAGIPRAGSTVPTRVARPAEGQTPSVSAPGAGNWGEVGFHHYPVEWLLRDQGRLLAPSSRGMMMWGSILVRAA